MLIAPAQPPAPAVRPPVRPRVRPSVAPIAARDGGIDLVRAACVAGVVLLHAMMVGVTVTATGPVFENASEGTGWIAPLSWLLQVMPLFFVIGGFSGWLAFRSQQAKGISAAGFVAARIHRLLLPAAVTVGTVGVLLAVLLIAGVPVDLVAIAGFRFGQPLWFLGVFLLCQALLPALVAAHRNAPLRTIAALTAAAVAVDAIRAVSGIDALGFLNLAFVWLALQQLGFFLADGSIDAVSRRVRTGIGIGAVVALAGTVLCGVYSADLIANINPPTAALLLVGVAHTSALSLLREPLARISRRPRVAAFTAFVTRRTMTIYLWHMPVLLVMAGASAVFALTTGANLPAPSSLEWWLSRPLWLATVALLTAIVAVPLARIENRAPSARTRSRRRVASGAVAGLIAVVVLLVVGTSPATAAIAVSLFTGALVLSRSAHVRAATAAAQRRDTSRTLSAA